MSRSPSPFGPLRTPASDHWQQARSNREPTSNVSRDAGPRAASVTELAQLAFIRRALSPDRAAIGVLVREFTPIIHAAAARASFKSSRRTTAELARDAEDVTQEVLLQLFGSRNSPLLAWDPRRSSLAGFIRVVARRRVLDAARRERHDPLSSRTAASLLIDDMTHPDAPPERLAMLRQELHAVVERARALLSPKGFEMFLHLWFDAKPMETICDVTGQTRANVYQWRHRIQRLLRAAAPHSVRP